MTFLPFIFANFAKSLILNILFRVKVSKRTLRYGDRARLENLVNSAPAERRKEVRSLYEDDYPARNNARDNAISAVDRRAQEMLDRAIRSRTSTRNINRIIEARSRMRAGLRAKGLASSNG